VPGAIDALQGVASDLPESSCRYRAPALLLSIPAAENRSAPCDTLYPQPEITDLAPHGDTGQVTTRATIHNKHGQLVLDGEHTYLLQTAQQSTSKVTS
jgi:hypothetical protein